MARTREEIGDPDEVEDEGPQPEDLVTEDHIHVYQVEGKLAFTTNADDFNRDCQAWMKEHNFFPNVWFISDHGNAHLVQTYA